MANVNVLEEHLFESGGRRLTALVGRAPNDRRQRMVALLHGLHGDLLGNGNTYVRMLRAQLRLRNMGFALLQRGGQGVDSYPGGTRGGGVSQTLEQEVADTRAGLRLLATRVGYERVDVVGFSLGATIAAAALTPEFVSTFDASLGGLAAISPTRMSTWMAGDPRHDRLLANADRLVAQGRGQEVVVTDHQPYYAPWQAGAYASMSRADILEQLRGMDDAVPVAVAYGTNDPDVERSYGGLHMLVRGVEDARPSALIGGFTGAPHNFIGHEVHLADFVVDDFFLE